MLRKLVMVALTTGLAAHGLRLWRERAARMGGVSGQGNTKRDHVQAVQRWEDEGGTPQPEADSRGTAPQATQALAKGAQSTST